jgi:RAB protein geranylgeranyltransferase component A
MLGFVLKGQGSSTFVSVNIFGASVVSVIMKLSRVEMRPRSSWTIINQKKAISKAVNKDFIPIFPLSGRAAWCTRGYYIAYVNRL